MIQHIIVLALFFIVIAYHGYKLFTKKNEGHTSGKCAKCPSAGKTPAMNEK